jgi:hypothetical protein
VAGGIFDPVDDALGELDAIGEVTAGFVVDRVDVERLGADRCAQLVDERLTDAADADRLSSAAGEHRLDVRAWLRGADCHRGAEQPAGNHQCCDEDTTDLA